MNLLREILTIDGKITARKILGRVAKILWVILLIIPILLFAALWKLSEFLVELLMGFTEVLGHKIDKWDGTVTEVEQKEMWKILKDDQNVGK